MTLTKPFRRCWQLVLRKAAKTYIERFRLRQPIVRGVFVGDFTSTRIILDGVYERRELEMLGREVFPQLPKASLALDIGANIGNHTVWFSGHFDRIVAFEPNPMVAALLRANTMALGEAVEVVEVGLSDCAGEVDFKIDGDHLGASCIADKPADLQVAVERLDAFVDALDLHGVSFVKIDVEGHEEKMIAGAADLLLKAKPVIAMEGYYAGDPQKAERVWTLLSRLGYRHCYRLSDRRRGEGRALPFGAPKFLRRLRPLHLEEIGRLGGENYSLAIISADPILPV